MKSSPRSESFDERLLAATRSRRSVVVALAAVIGLVGNRQPVEVEAGTCVRPCGGTCCPDHHVCHAGACVKQLNIRRSTCSRSGQDCQLRRCCDGLTCRYYDHGDWGAGFTCV